MSFTGHSFPEIPSGQSGSELWSEVGWTLLGSGLINDIVISRETDQWQLLLPAVTAVPLHSSSPIVLPGSL